MTQQQVPPRRARHLIDPANPPAPPTAEDIERLDRVKRIVMSVLVFTTILHLSVGLVIAATFLDAVGAQVGLCLIGGVTGALGVAATRAIHRRAPVSPWLVVGFVPTVVGLLIVLR